MVSDAEEVVAARHLEQVVGGLVNDKGFLAESHHLVELRTVIMVEDVVFNRKGVGLMRENAERQGDA